MANFARWWSISTGVFLNSYFAFLSVIHVFFDIHFIRCQCVIHVFTDDKRRTIQFPVRVFGGTREKLFACDPEKTKNILLGSKVTKMGERKSSFSSGKSSPFFFSCDEKLACKSDYQCHRPCSFFLWYYPSLPELFLPPPLLSQWQTQKMFLCCTPFLALPFKTYTYRYIHIIYKVYMLLLFFGREERSTDPRMKLLWASLFDFFCGRTQRRLAMWWQNSGKVQRLLERPPAHDSPMSWTLSFVLLPPFCSCLSFYWRRNTEFSLVSRVIAKFHILRVRAMWYACIVWPVLCSVWHYNYANISNRVFLSFISTTVGHRH